jgi:deoxyribodipyrimidine photo-lyase
MPVLVWLRRDLRLHDHPALHAALAADDDVVPCFCFDRRLLRGRHRSGPRTQFLLESLADLSASLRARGSGLVLLDGAPQTALPRLARELGARHVHATADIGPFARRRSDEVRESLARGDAELHLHQGLFVVDHPERVKTRKGTPYLAFGAFHRAWLNEPRRAPLAAPVCLPAIPRSRRSDRLPALADLGLAGSSLADPMRGGERPGRARAADFLAGPVHSYASERDMLASEPTSRLSPYLHFGCISPRELEARLADRPGADAVRRQLAWRDFYAQILWHHPANARAEHQRRYRRTLSWSGDRAAFGAWCRGETGYPVVDAAMRQLAREGWMPNRARMVTASFLSKHLGIDWRWGERWFMSLLLDGDEASNNGNWQWIASVGVDREPVSRRLFNPTRQQVRFDPTGEYVRRYVPELRGLPDRYLAEPWTAPPEVQRAARCVIGVDYPAPIVEHRAAREEAVARYARARLGSQAA